VICSHTSALVKLVFEEAEGTALAEWLSVRAVVPKISSDLSTVELLRTCRRIDEDAVGDATLLLGGIDLLPMDRGIVEKAATLVPEGLRSLDAIHLASALRSRPPDPARGECATRSPPDRSRQPRGHTGRSATCYSRSDQYGHR
jgi:predicted nucleic acid-binding protein